MNKKQTEAAIAVMQAFVDGKVIEFTHAGLQPGEWAVAVDPRWGWENGFEYRVRPEQVYAVELSKEEREITIASLSTYWSTWASSARQKLLNATPKNSSA